MNRNSSECALCSGPSIAAAAKDPVLPGEKARSEFWLGFPCGKHQVMVCAVYSMELPAAACSMPHLESRLAILCLFGCTPVPIRTFARSRCSIRLVPHL